MRLGWPYQVLDVVLYFEAVLFSTCQFQFEP